MQQQLKRSKPFHWSPTAYSSSYSFDMKVLEYFEDGSPATLKMK